MQNIYLPIKAPWPKNQMPLSYFPVSSLNIAKFKKKGKLCSSLSDPDAVMEIYFQSHSTYRIYYKEEKCSSSKALKQKQSDLLGHMQKKS